MRQGFWTSGGSLIGYSIVRLLMDSREDAMFALFAGMMCIFIYLALCMIARVNPLSDKGSAE